MQEGHPASETIRERLRELGELWDELQANSRRKAAMLQVVCEVGSVCQGTGQRRLGGGGGSRPLPLVPTSHSALGPASPAESGGTRELARACGG